MRAAQFLRSGGSNHTVELYHDRIRETLAAQLLPAKVIQIHRRLAHTLEARGIDDPEALFEHYIGAGERVRAATHAGVAAKKAAGALAFDRAAAFFRRALELAPSRGAELIDLKRGLAEALANAGRPAEAAQAYLDLSEDTSASRSLDYKRRAAEQLLMGGHIKEGLEIMGSVLAAVGFTLPAGPKRALLSLILKRVQIRLRGLNFTERDASEISQADLFRIDLCWAVAAGLGAVDLTAARIFIAVTFYLHCAPGTFQSGAGDGFEKPPRRRRAGRTQSPCKLRASMTFPEMEIPMHGLSSGHRLALTFGPRKKARNSAEAAEVLRDHDRGYL